MTHFNHEWNGSPAIPEAIGDRYYAQDLNDDFNYLKHLPYEVFLQGRSRGVMIAPSDTWDNDTNSLTLSGGFGVILQDNLCVDPDEDFVVPPITKSSPRYERVPLVDTTLILPNDGITHYIVATPTKRSLLQRMKTVLSESYASRIRYDGVITIQDTAPTAGQILIGLCHNKEYCLLIDNDINQCKENIILKKWFGQNKITQDFVSKLQSYYNTTIASIETKISIGMVNNDGNGINGGTFNNCIVNIDLVDYYGNGINGGTFNNSIISIGIVNNNGNGINGGTFNNSIISIDAISDDGYGVELGTFNNCTITIDAISDSSRGINSGTFNNCYIYIDKVDSSRGINGGTFNNCTIYFDWVSGTYGIYKGTFNTCTITFRIAPSSGVGNNSNVILYLTRIICSAVTSLANTGGKLNVLNDTVLHTS